MNQQAIAQITAKVRMVVNDERSIGVLSTGERIAVAMVLDRRDLLTYGTMLESAYRLGNDWLEAALRVQRDGWEGE